MTIKLKTCSLFSETIAYAGHTIVPDKLHVATKTIKAFKALQYLTTVLEMKSFSGLCNVYRRFVPKFAKSATLLIKKQKKRESSCHVTLAKKKWRRERTWKEGNNATSACTTTSKWAFHRWYWRLLHSSGVRPTTRTRRQCFKPTGCLSRSLCAPEQRYDTTPKICLALVWAFLMQKI